MPIGGPVIPIMIGTDHTQNTDTSLDLGGTNPITAAQLVTLKDVTVPSKKVFHGIETSGAITWGQTGDGGADRILTVTGPVTYWYQGTKYTTASDVVCNLRDEYPAGLTANNLYYIAFEDATGELKASQTMNLKTKCPICMVFWNGTNAAITLETHNHTRDLDWHINAHRTIGTRYWSGLNITSPTGAGNEDVLNITSGYMYDEDILHTLDNAKMTGLSRIFHRVSADVFTFVNSTLPYAGTTGAPTFLDTDTYALATFAANNFACYWVYATGDIDRPIYIYPTHAASAYNNISSARAEQTPNITGVVANSLNPEMKLLFRWIYKGNGDWQETVDYRLSAPLPAGGTAPATAAGVTFVPSAGLLSTNVQSAIEETRKTTEVIKASTGAISADECLNSIISNNGQAAEMTLTFTTPEQGWKGSFQVVTTGNQINFAPVSGGALVLDGVVLDADDPVSIVAPVLHDYIKFHTVKQADNSYALFLDTGRGTWIDGGA